VIGIGIWKVGLTLKAVKVFEVIGIGIWIWEVGLKGSSGFLSDRDLNSRIHVYHFPVKSWKSEQKDRRGFEGIEIGSWKVGLMVIQVLEWSGSGVEK
jgi:hypothetical protein